MKLKDEKEIICKHKVEENNNKKSFQYAELSFLPLKKISEKNY